MWPGRGRLIVPTAPSGDSSNRIADTAFVAAAISGLASSASVTAAVQGIGPVVAGGRLTLTSGAPVLTSTVSGATTIFYTPYTSQFVPLFDGTNFNMTNTGGELSQATTDTTKSPAAVAANSLYDLFVWSDGGTFRCTRGPLWTSSSARGTGAGTTELVSQNGIWLNKNAITNGPAASRGTYVGTIASNGGSTIDFILGGSASGGTAGVLNVWNAYNRVNVKARVTDSGAPYTYLSATIRQARASAGNQISFVSGLAEDTIFASYFGDITLAGNVSGFGQFGIGLDSTTSFDASPVLLQTPIAVGNNWCGTAIDVIAPQLGQHTIFANEANDGAAHANSFDGLSNNFITAQLRM